MHCLKILAAPIPSSDMRVWPQ